MLIGIVIGVLGSLFIYFVFIYEIKGSEYDELLARVVEVESFLPVTPEHESYRSSAVVPMFEVGQLWLTRRKTGNWAKEHRFVGIVIVNVGTNIVRYREESFDEKTATWAPVQTFLADYELVELLRTAGVPSALDSPLQRAGAVIEKQLGSRGPDEFVTSDLIKRRPSRPPPPPPKKGKPVSE